MSAQTDLDKVLKAQKDLVRQYTYKNRTYTLAELPGLIRELRAAVAEEQKAAGAKKKEAERLEATRGIKSATAARDKAKKAFENAGERYLDGTLTAQQLETFRIAYLTSEETLARLTPTKPVARPSGTTATTKQPQMGQTVEERRLAAAAAAAANGGGGGGGGGGKGGGGKGGAKPEKPEEPPKPEVTAQNILDELAARFPAYQDWTVEQATSYFGADLIKVLTDTANGVYGVGANKNTEAIKRAIEGTGYWRTTAAAIKNWDQLAKPDQDRRVADQKRLLAQTFGELQLDDFTLTNLATTIQRTGLDQLGAKQLVFGEAFARPRTGTGPQSAQLALESAAADNLRNIARAYGFRPSDLDAQIQAILTGKPYAPTGTVLTEEAFRQKAQKDAAGAFPHLKDQFDSGLTLNDVFGNYREIASRVLELDPNEVDYMKDDKWLAAFGTQKDGLPSLSSWVTTLKTDPKYGWRFTNQANQQASSVVATLEKAFGLIR